MTYTEEDNRTLWQRRAVRSGMHYYKNKKVDELSDAEIIEAFAVLSRETGIYYVWGKK